MAEFGLVSGLAQSGQYDQKINDLRYAEDANRRAQAAAEQKAKMFADSMEFQNAMNPHDNLIIKNFAKQKQYEIGQFVRQNPDYAYNPEKRVQLNQMLHDLKDNPDLQRGMASDSAYKAYLKDLQEVAKNPQQHDMTAYDDVQRQWDNYIKFGNQDGQEAASKQGKKSFLYSKPRDFVDTNKDFMEFGNGFKDMKTRSIKGGRNAYEEYANPESLRAISMDYYNNNRRQIDIAAAKQGVDPITYVENGINAHIPKKRDFGDYGLSDALTAASFKHKLEREDLKVPTNQSAYQSAFVNKDSGIVGSDVLEQTYGSKPKNIIYSNKGDQQIDNTGNRVYYTGVHKWIETKDKTGRPQRQKVVETYSYIPLEDAKQKGIIEDPFGFSGAGGTDFEVTPEWNKQAEILSVPNSKGENQPVVKVKALMPVELNEAYAGAFDNQVHFAKSKLIAQTPQEGGQEVPAASVSEWKSAGWSDAQIQQAAQQGKIIVK